MIWGRKFTGATVLFVLNRYLALFKYPIYIADLIPISDKVRVQLSDRPHAMSLIDSCLITEVYIPPWDAYKSR